MQLLGQQLQPCYSLPIRSRRRIFLGTGQTLRCSRPHRLFRSVSRQVKIFASLNAAVPSCVSLSSLFLQLLQVSCGSATAVRYTSGKQENARASTSEMPQHWTQKQRDQLQRFAKLPLRHTTLHNFCKHSVLLAHPLGLSLPRQHQAAALARTRGGCGGLADVFCRHLAGTGAVSL